MAVSKAAKPATAGTVDRLLRDDQPKQLIVSCAGDPSLDTKTISIIVEPVARAPGRFTAALTDGSIVCSSVTPMLTAARKLLALGHSPGALLLVRHVNREDVTMSARLGQAAELSVDEHNGTVFAKWKAFSRSAVGPRKRLLATTATPTAARLKNAWKRP